MTGPDPDTASAIAVATANQTIPVAAAMYESFQLKVMDPGGEARITRPNLARNLAAGAALGLIGGLLLAYLAALFSERYARRGKTEKDPSESLSPLSPETSVVGSNQL